MIGGVAGVIQAALERLGKQRLVLAIHDASFPSAPGEDTGRGTPYARGGADFLRFAAGLGFTGIQLGPQGQTSRVNQSPYDGTLFSRNVLSVALFPLAEDPAWGGLLQRGELEALVLGRPPGGGRVHYHYLFDAQRRALRRAYRNFRRDEAAARAGLRDFRRVNRDWLERDALYEVLFTHYGCRDHAQWEGPAADLDRHLYSPPPDALPAAKARRRALRASHRRDIWRYVFCQFVLHRQHQQLRDLAGGLGLRLYGDLQIGISRQDAWGRSLFLPGYLLGAPPSRTNPEGQPWGYPVLDPARYHRRSAPGPVLRFVRRRVARLLAEFDGLRIDHPHGLVCPWVYRSDDPDPLHAVQHGARLFSTPGTPGHEALARFSLVSADQLDPAVPPHDDHQVRSLTGEQVARYSVLCDEIVAAAREAGRDPGDLICEVLSTMPLPLHLVMRRHGLGRFLVTQKADLDRPGDVYRSENAAPPDWIMVGNHDTRPVWLLIEQWPPDRLAGRAAYLAERLAPTDPARRAGLAAGLSRDPRRLAQALFADLFASPARNVMIFFTDLLGMNEPYNTPGTISEHNWTLRVPATYRELYIDRLRTGAALDLPAALGLALRARGLGEGDELVRGLMALSGQEWLDR